MVIARDYNGDTWYLGDWKRNYYIRRAGNIFQVAFYGAILSFNKIKKTNFLYWSNARIFYWVVPHHTGATHSVGLWKFEITLVFNFRKQQ